MTQEQDTSTTNADDTQVSAPSLGAQLKAARDEARLSLGEVSKKLLITTTRLKALESGDYSQLPAKVFVVGYIKNYAELVNIDEAPLLEQYERESGSSESPAEQHTLLSAENKVNRGNTLVGQTLNTAKPKPKWLLPVSVFGVAALVLIAVVFMRDSGVEPSSENVKTLVNQTVEKNIQEQAIVTNANVELNSSFSQQLDLSLSNESSSNESSSDVSNNSGGDINSDSAEIASEGVTSSQTNSAENALQANVIAEQASINDDLEDIQQQEVSASFESSQSIDTLVFRFDEECWLNVKEVEGNVIYSGTAAAGSTLTLEGRGPFELMVGNAASASLSLNGEPISIEPQRGRRTARLSVGG